MSASTYETHTPNRLNPSLNPEINTQRLEVKRLVVLVPDQGADGNELARRVWALAAPCELQVLFLCVLGAKVNREPVMRLRLATLAALIHDERIVVTTQVVLRQSWVTTVRRVSEPGDLVLCCSEQTVPTVASGWQPLYRVLECTMDIPVFVLSGLYSEPSEYKKLGNGRARQVIRWPVIAALAIVLVLVATQINQQVTGFDRNLPLLVVGLIELGVVLALSMRT